MSALDIGGDPGAHRRLDACGQTDDQNDGQWPGSERPTASWRSMTEGGLRGFQFCGKDPEAEESKEEAEAGEDGAYAGDAQRVRGKRRTGAGSAGPDQVEKIQFPAAIFHMARGLQEGKSGHGHAQANAIDRHGRKASNARGEGQPK